MSDVTTALVERARGGDHDAFAQLAAASIDRMNAIAWLILRDLDDAEDAVQDALVRTWRELPRLREADRFDAWLRRLLVNACHDISRRRRRRALVAIAMSTPDGEAHDDWMRFEDHEQLARAFQRLPIEQRIVLVLEHYVGLTGPEIAAATGVSLGTAKSRARYARSAMRAALEADARAGLPAGGLGR
jgi:RNA polymerase sigma-70 factor (ECF subfamily)